MTTISIQLSEKTLASLRAIAASEGTSIEKVVETTLEKAVSNEVIVEPGRHEFEEAMRYVLDKNAELYKRLA
ncbi:MAG: DNA-binding protein [Bacteroidia bacterium]